MTPTQVARHVHPVAGGLALLAMLIFWTSTVVVELAGDRGDIAAVKHAILWGLLVLVPALAATGGTGFLRAGRSKNARILAKKRRMQVVAPIGILVLVPCVLYLGLTTSPDGLGTYFYPVQGVELLAGAVNITLMSLNARDGLRLTGRLGSRRVNV
ncbi:MAG: hypothetical protein ACRDOT_04945 [Aeromicrobium sp.]